MNNQNKIDNLYTFIKEKVKLKGRKLKIVCDWDECLQAAKPFLLWEAGKKNKTFAEYFKRFWKKAKMAVPKPGDSEDYKHEIIMELYPVNWWNYSYIDPDDYLIEKDNFEQLNNGELRRKMKKKNEHYSNQPTFYDRTAFLSISQELLWSLKEDLIEKLTIITAYLKGVNPPGGNPKKRKKYEETFGCFPNTHFISIETTNPSKPGENYSPYRWEWVKRNLSDFDIFIDDQSVTVEETNKLLPDDRLYIVPAYKCTDYLQAPNIYHVETSATDLKDEDFVKAAAECWAKKEAKEAKRKAEIAKHNQQIRKENWNKAGAVYSLLFLINFFCLFFIIKKWQKKVKVKQK